MHIWVTCVLYFSVLWTPWTGCGSITAFSSMQMCLTCVYVHEYPTILDQKRHWNLRNVTLKGRKSVIAAALASHGFLTAYHRADLLLGYHDCHLDTVKILVLGILSEMWVMDSDAWRRSVWNRVTSVPVREFLYFTVDYNDLFVHLRFGSLAEIINILLSSWFYFPAALCVFV